MVTAFYYLSNNHKLDRFKTELFIDGFIEDNILHGDLYLKGYGDPTLKTDDLSLFIDSVKKTKPNEIIKIPKTMASFVKGIFNRFLAIHYIYKSNKI